MNSTIKLSPRARILIVRLDTLATATKIAAVGNGLLATQDPNEQATILQKSAQEVGTLVQNARLNPKGADLFTRTNQVFGISAEFRF